MHLSEYPLSVLGRTAVHRPACVSVASTTTSTSVFSQGDKIVLCAESKEHQLSLGLYDLST